MSWLRRTFLGEAREERDLVVVGDPTIPPAWSELSGGYTHAGVNVTMANTVGLPAVASAVRLLADTTALLPLYVYRGRQAGKRLADDTWQYRLLAELPGDGDFTSYDLLSDISTCLELWGNAYLYKVKAAGEVIALLVVDPSKVRIERDDAGAKVFLVRNENGQEDPFSSTTILHIRGFSVGGSDTGLSPIALHRQRLGSLLAQDEYHGKFYRQGSMSGGILETDDEVSPEDGRELLAQYAAQATGLRNAHLPVLLQNGLKFNKTSISPKDAQFVESAQLNLLDVANIFRIPPSFLGVQQGEGSSFEQDNLRFYTLCMAPRLRRIEMALHRDPDLFPQRDLYPEFETKSLLRTDALTRAQVLHYEIQDGRTLVDEARAEEGKGPLPPLSDDWTQTPGMVPQVTPVGGAPNPAVAASQEPSSE